MKRPLQVPESKIKKTRYWSNWPVQTTELILDLLDLIADKIKLDGIDRRDFEEIKEEIERRIEYGTE